MKTIVIFSFMIKDLKLKGSELLVYALVYSFSQFREGCFMKCDNMAFELGISRSQVFRALSSLVKKNFIFNNGEAYFTHNKDLISTPTELRLAEQIRIAKTPWLDQ